MRNRTKDRLPFKEAMAHTRRGYAIWWKAAPEIFLAAAVERAANALTPYLPLYFTARLVNAIAAGETGEQVRRMLWLLLASTALAGLVRAASACWSKTEYCRVWPEYYRIIVQKLLSMDFCDVDNPGTQDLLNRIEQNRNWSLWGLWRLYRHFCELVEAVFRIIGAAALSWSLFALRVRPDSALAWLNHPLCLAGVAALMAASVAAAGAMANKSNSYWAKYDGAAVNRCGRFLFYCASGERWRNADIRAYAQDRFIESAAREMMNGEHGFGPNSSIGRAARGPMGVCEGASRAVTQAFTGVIYLFAGLKALGGAFGVGSVTQYAGALAGLARGLAALLETLGSLRTNAEYLRAVYEFLDIPNSMYQGSLTTEKRSDRKYEIEFRDVSFKYPGTDIWALRHVDMKFQVGERLAVVGENGSGKTTFIKLLCRLYDPTEGAIFLNGIDIRKYRYDDYLALFSVVFQDFRLLAQPLGQNVAAAIDYDRAKAEDCLERAGFGERLTQLPKGLDTCLYRDFEDDGVEISGGEAQKIALARVLYQDAPFIVLDEPTAALDPEAEAEVYTKFNDIVEDKTAIYISHRLSSCRFCDEIAVFDAGRVVQLDTHDNLLEAEGKYRSLWEAQAQYYRKKET